MDILTSISPNPVTSYLKVNIDKDIRAIELYSIDGEINIYNYNPK